jgi:exonuclease SbcD
MNRKVRVLHAADFHLGSPFSGLSSQKAAIRQGEQHATFRAVIHLCKQNDIQLLLLAGDILDQLRLSGEQIRSIRDLFAGIPDTTIVISPGNHDPYNQDSPYMSELWSANVHIFTGEFSHFYFPELHVTVWGAAFTGIRAVNSLCPPNFHVKDAPDSPEGTIHIVLLHGEITETSAEKRSYNPVLRDWIGRSGADYAAIGHVHEKSGVCRQGNTFYAYPGCPEARGFDEPGPRGVYMGTIAKGKTDLAYVHVNQRNYFCPDIPVDGCGTQEQTEDRILSFLHKEYGDSYARDAFRITLTGALPTDYTPNLGNLRERLAARVFAVHIKDHTRTQIDPQQLRREMSLRGAFAELLLNRMEEARAAQDEKRVLEYEQALTVGLRAFEGEVMYCEDQ